MIDLEPYEFTFTGLILVNLNSRRYFKAALIFALKKNYQLDV